jgi:hypothetical protein
MSTGSKATLFEWIDQLTLAKELVQRDDESALRTVIYLAYYAVYNTVVGHLLSHGATIGKESTHWTVWGLLNHGKGAKPKLVHRGRAFRDLRNKASYDLDLPKGFDLKRDAQQALKSAEAMLSELKR